LQVFFRSPRTGRLDDGQMVPCGHGVAGPGPDLCHRAGDTGDHVGSPSSWPSGRTRAGLPPRRRRRRRARRSPCRAWRTTTDPPAATLPGAAAVAADGAGGERVPGPGWRPGRRSAQCREPTCARRGAGPRPRAGRGPSPQAKRRAGGAAAVWPRSSSRSTQVVSWVPATKVAGEDGQLGRLVVATPVTSVSPSALNMSSRAVRRSGPPATRLRGGPSRGRRRRRPPRPPAPSSSCGGQADPVRAGIHGRGRHPPGGHRRRRHRQGDQGGSGRRVPLRPRRHPSRAGGAAGVGALRAHRPAVPARRRLRDVPRRQPVGEWRAARRRGPPGCPGRRGGAVLLCAVPDSQRST